MKIIGERINILKKDNLLSIVILPTTDKKKLGLLFLWLMAWTVCGIIKLANYFRLTEQGAKLFVIIDLSFWAYFEYSITKAFHPGKNSAAKNYGSKMGNCIINARSIKKEKQPRPTSIW